MDNSFKLFSTMTPLINKTRRNLPHKKVPSSLSLKKNVRRSSVFDTLPLTQANNSLELIEGSTTDATDSTSSQKGLNIINTSPIVISDSDVSEVGDDNPINTASLNLHLKRNQDEVHPKSKFTTINEWLLKVNSETQNDRLCSSPNVKSNEGCDAHKNKFYDFDQMLESLTTKINDCGTRKTDNQSCSSSSDSNVNIRLIKRLHKNTPMKQQLKTCNTNIKRNNIDKDPKNNVKSAVKNKIIDSDTSSSLNGSNEVGENLLDELYGAKWRDSKDLILTRSEPRYKKNINIEKRLRTDVKRKSKFMHQNPYLDSQPQTPFTVISSEHLTSSKTATESPWVKRLQSLCDSDSSEQSINRIIKKYTAETKTRLSFNIDDGKDQSKNDNYKGKSSWLKVFDESVNSATYVLSTEKSVKTIEGIGTLSSSDEENREPLEDRLRKKLVLDKKKRNIEPLLKNIEGADKNNLNNLSKKNKDKQVKRNIFEDKIPDTVNSKLPVKTKKKTDEKIKSGVKRKSLESVLQPKITNNVDVHSSSSLSYSFLASLSKTVRLSQCDAAARIFRNSFQTFKTELTTRLFKLYNEKIFNNAIPDDSPLEWNDRMRGTAGYCYCKKIIRRTGLVERKIRIVLSVKVLDSADRLRDTLVHEMCHAATWIVNQVANGHGNYWKAWAHKARQVFPELPPIKRCHDYVINTKYTYKCVDCGYSIGRHTKSLDIEKKRCGYCYGKFEVLINKVSKAGETKSVPVTPKKAPSAFALFVKENYATFKTPQLNHGQLMKLLGQKYGELKATGSED